MRRALLVCHGRVAVWFVVTAFMRSNARPAEAGHYEHQPRIPNVDDYYSRTRFRFHLGMTTPTSDVPLGTHWQLSRDSVVTAGASSSMSSSSSVAGLQLFPPCAT